MVVKNVEEESKESIEPEESESSEEISIEEQKESENIVEGKDSTK